MKNKPMLILLPIVIVMAFTLPFPLNMIQAIAGSLSLGSKITMLLTKDAAK